MFNKTEFQTVDGRSVDTQIGTSYSELERRILDEIQRQLDLVDSFSLLTIAMANGSRRGRTKLEVTIPLDDFDGLTPEYLSTLRDMSLEIERQELIGIGKPTEFTPYASNRLAETSSMPNGDQLTPRQTALVDMAEEYCRSHFPAALASHLDVVVRAETQIIDSEDSPAIKLILYPNLKVDAKTVVSTFHNNFGYINEMSGPKLIDGKDGLPSACFFSVNSSLDVLSKGLVDLIGSGKVAFHVSEGTNQLSLIRQTDLTPDEVEALNALEPTLAAVNKWLAGFDLPSSTISVLRQALDRDGKKHLAISRVKFQMSLRNETRFLMTDKKVSDYELTLIHSLINTGNSSYIQYVATELGGVTIRLDFTPIVEQQPINPNELPYYQTIWDAFTQDQAAGEANTDPVVVLGPDDSHNYYVREHKIAPGCNLYMDSDDNAVVV